MDAFIVISLIKVLVVFAVLMTTLAYLQWVERKVIAHIQVRPSSSFTSCSSAEPGLLVRTAQTGLCHIRPLF